MNQRNFQKKCELNPVVFIHTIDVQIKQIAGITSKEQVKNQLETLKTIPGVNKIKQKNTVVLNLNEYAGRELLTLSEADQTLKQFCTECRIGQYSLSRVDICFNFNIPFDSMMPLGTFLVDCWRSLRPKGRSAFITQPSEQINEIGWRWSGCTCIMYNKAEEIAVRGTHTIGSDYDTRIEMQLFPKAEWQARSNRSISLKAIIDQYAVRNLSQIDSAVIECAIDHRVKAIEYLRPETRTLVQLIDRTRSQIYSMDIMKRLYSQQGNKRSVSEWLSKNYNESVDTFDRTSPVYVRRKIADQLYRREYLQSFIRLLIDSITAYF